MIEFNGQIQAKEIRKVKIGGFVIIAHMNLEGEGQNLHCKGKISMLAVANNSYCFYGNREIYSEVPNKRTARIREPPDL